MRSLAAILAAAALLLVLRADARAQQIPLPVAVSNGAGIVVRAEQGMQSLAESVARDARGTLDAIAADLADLPVPRQVEIRLVKRAEDLARAAPEGRGAPPWAIGVAYPDVGVVVVAYRRGPMPADVRSTVRHELAHLALGAALGARAPRWLHEGFAYLHSSDFSLDRTRTLTGMAWTGDVIPLAELDDSFPAAEMAAARAYAESYDFVAFLARRGRSAASDDDGNRWPFRRFLALVAGGTPLDRAARQAFSADLAHLFAEWKESLRQRYLMLPAGLLGVLIWVAASVLLILAWLRKRRLNRRTLARWEEEEARVDWPVD
ncbi:MAG TPA: hypothetical protein VFU21_15850 [Kofleriaceae bacterium]|nr:hypothetical protein [Kofleriaceae bacterium]